jgi:hypothetical protein
MPKADKSDTWSWRAVLPSIVTAIVTVTLTLIGGMWVLSDRLGGMQSDITHISEGNVSLSKSVQSLLQDVSFIKGQLAGLDRKVGLVSLEKQTTLAMQKSPDTKATAGIIRSVGQYAIKIENIQGKSFDYAITKNTKIKLNQEGKEKDISLQGLSTGNRVLITQKASSGTDKTVESVIKYPWEPIPWESVPETKSGSQPSLNEPAK